MAGGAKSLAAKKSIDFEGIPMMQTKMCGTLVVLLLLAGMASVSAQAPKAADKDAQPPVVIGAQPPVVIEDTTDKKPGPDVLIGPPPAAKPGPQAAEFARLLAEFKKLEAEAGTIKVKYQSADAGRRPQMKKEFDQLLVKLDALLEQLIAAAEKAYTEAPNADNNVTGVLYTVLERRVQQNDDEAALALGKLLLDHHCMIPEVASLTGTAAFAVGDSGAAEKYLQLASKGGGLSEKGQSILDGLAWQRRVAAAEKAYVAAPNADKKVTEVLCTALERRVKEDDDEAAYALGKLLLDHQCTVPQVPDLAGTAAFAIGELDAAEKYLQLAAKGEGLSQQGRAILDGLPANRQAWEKEQQIRQAEAKADDLPRVLLKTSRGPIELELFENEAPNTVANFITLVQQGFYNGVTFHRVLPGFMAQGGDPQGSGEGGPGYQIAEEFTKPAHRLHFRGSLAMARSQSPDSAGSQFYIMFAPNNQLDGNYTVFGRVIKGFEVLAKIQRRDPQKPDQPAPDKIVKAEVLRKRPHKYEVKKLAE
jgi:cyclophilin family peptidyl-prolyl cis-trans isomerase